MTDRVVCVEQNVLLAVLEKDREEANRLLALFYPGELRALEEAAERLASACGRHLLLKAHEAGEHEGMAAARKNSFGDLRPGSIDSRVHGCPKCHEIAGFDPPEESWS